MATETTVDKPEETEVVEQVAVELAVKSSVQSPDVIQGGEQEKEVQAEPAVEVTVEKADESQGGTEMDPPARKEQKQHQQQVTFIRPNDTPQTMVLKPTGWGVLEAGNKGEEVRMKLGWCNITESILRTFTKYFICNFHITLLIEYMPYIHHNI